nr:hypothetical protein [uncultured Desulfobacter sp.]
MNQSKKAKWVSAIFVFMFTLVPGILAASEPTTLSFPGNGYVGVSVHTQIPADLSWLILGITQSDINHSWVTATVDGVQGVIHADGYMGNVHFLCWPDFLNLCIPGSIRLFKPDKMAIGYAELEGFGFNLSRIPPILRNLLARRLGNIMINMWIHKMLDYNGVPYDFYFMPWDNQIYCSELLAHGWTKTRSSFKLFPPHAASTLPGWNVDTHQPDGVTYGMLLEASGFRADIPVYNVADIFNNPYFEEINVD